MWRDEDIHQQECIPNCYRPFLLVFCTEEMKSVRTHDGTCNDLNHPASGSRYYRFGRNINRTKTFEDKNLFEPSPRELSKRQVNRVINSTYTKGVVLAILEQFFTEYSSWVPHRRNLLDQAGGQVPFQLQNQQHSRLILQLFLSL